MSDEEQGENGSATTHDIQLQLGEYLNNHRGERHLVILQDYPDPDAISSAFAYQLIGSEFDINVDIVYGGKISHQQNVALVKLLGITLIQYEPSLDFMKYDGLVFLDNQGTTSEDLMEALEPSGLPALIVIDHHEIQDRVKPEFSDIRRTGATATIFAQYFELGLVKMRKSRKDHQLVATALLHGIMSDTGNYIRAKEDDFYASAFLSTFRDTEMLVQIIRQSRSKQVMEIIHLALANRVIVESYSVAGIGYLRSVDRDMIPQAADFLLTEENVHTVIVYGIVAVNGREERLIGSMRTTKITLDPDEFIKSVFGKDARGYYFGGGKVSAGGFEIPVGFLSGGEVEEYIDLKWQVFDNQIKQKLFNEIGAK